MRVRGEEARTVGDTQKRCGGVRCREWSGEGAGAGLGAVGFGGVIPQSSTSFFGLSRHSCILSFSCFVFEGQSAYYMCQLLSFSRQLLSFSCFVFKGQTAYWNRQLLSFFSALSIWL
jgi:hypothetical protein